MSKQIRPNELAEIVTGLLVRPQKLGALNEAEGEHEAFIEAIGQVVTDFCGGRVNCVHSAELPAGMAPDLVDTPYLSVWPSDALPSLERCVWSLYDPQGWDDHVPAEFGLPGEAPMSDVEAGNHRWMLQGLLKDAFEAQQSASRVEHGLSPSKPSPFAQRPSGDPARCHVDVVGLGAVHLNRTDEGLIIDVWNQGTRECISTTALETSEFDNAPVIP